MSGFSEREQGFEKKLAFEGDKKFRATAKRNKLLAQWVGARTGMTPEQTSQYATELSDHDLKKPGDADVEEKVLADLRTRGVSSTAQEVRAEITRCMTQASAE